MTVYCALGRRRNDRAFIVDFHRSWAIVRTNTKFIADGVPLEPIDPGPYEFFPSMVLMRREWKKIYFLNVRNDWDDIDYFRYAEKRMKELGISTP